MSETGRARTEEYVHSISFVSVPRLNPHHHLPTLSPSRLKQKERGLTLLWLLHRSLLLSPSFRICSWGSVSSCLQSSWTRHPTSPRSWWHVPKESAAPPHTHTHHRLLVTESLWQSKKTLDFTWCFLWNLFSLCSFCYPFSLLVKSYPPLNHLVSGRRGYRCPSR